eukprot:2465060-Rhodomonas_salina.2
MEGVGSEDLLEMGDEDIYGNDTGQKSQKASLQSHSVWFTDFVRSVGSDGLPVDGTEVVWEEAVARAVEKVRTPSTPHQMSDNTLSLRTICAGRVVSRHSIWGVHVVVFPLRFLPVLVRGVALIPDAWLFGCWSEPCVSRTMR